MNEEKGKREMGKQSVASISRHRLYSLKWLPLATLEMQWVQWGLKVHLGGLENIRKNI